MNTLPTLPGLDEALYADRCNKLMCAAMHTTCSRAQLEDLLAWATAYLQDNGDPEHRLGRLARHLRYEIECARALERCEFALGEEVEAEGPVYVLGPLQGSRAVSTPRNGYTGTITRISANGHDLELDGEVWVPNGRCSPVR